MKYKKAVVVLVIALFVATFASAQMLKSYYDWENGYSGKAYALYVNTTNTVDPIDVASSVREYSLTLGLHYLRPAHKLSKQEYFLIKSALNEYNCSKNEIYYVTLVQGREMLLLVVDIIDSQFYNWCSVGYWSI